MRRWSFAIGSAEVAANAAIGLIHQTNYLLDQQLSAFEQQFLKEGGVLKRLYQARSEMRRRGNQ